MDSTPGGEAELARVDEVPFVDEANFSNGSQVAGTRPRLRRHPGRYAYPAE